MRAPFFDPSTPVLGCGDCGTPVHPHEEKCMDCTLREAEIVRLPTWPFILITIVLGLGSAILAPLCWSLFQIWRNE